MTRSLTGHIPLAFRIDHSVWRSTVTRVLVFTLYASLLWLLCDSKRLGRVAEAGRAITVLVSIVTGLLVSFRSSSSIERWSEGRRTWSALHSTTRTLLRALTLALSHPYSDPSVSAAAEEMLSLVLAFPIALKYHLRGLRGLHEPDLEPLLPRGYLASLRRTPNPKVRFAPSNPPSPALSPSPANEKSSPALLGPLEPAQSEQEETSRQLSQLNTSQALPASALRPALSSPAPSNLPLAILRMLHAYLDVFHQRGPEAAGRRRSEDEVERPWLSTPLWITSIGYVKELTANLTDAERIRDTPIPLALAIHLNQILSLYLLAVPPQILPSLGAWSIPVTALVAGVYFGIDAIGAELSDPFGTQPNDLPIDQYCSAILREALELGGPAAKAARGVLGGDSAAPARGADWVPRFGEQRPKEE